MPVAPLLFLTSALLVLSGAIEIRATARSGLGVPLLPVLELASGVALAVLAAAGASGATGAAGSAPGWPVPAGVVLVLVSSVRTSLLLKERRRLRELSAASRLQTYVKYLSGTKDEGSR